MQAQEYLKKGIAHMEDRAKQRDAANGERSMKRAVDIFNAWTDNKLTEDEGWRFMIALKQAREIQGEYNQDDYEDLAAYAGLLGESASEKPYNGDAETGGQTREASQTYISRAAQCANAISSDD